MNTATRSTLMLTALAVLGGCRDQRSVTSPHGISADFSDGRSAGGNPHFFFLPPLVGEPTFSGTFNPSLRPVVDICRLTVDAQQHPIACDGTAPINPGPVQLDLGDEQYQVNWHTDQPPIDVTKFYRIEVRGAPGARVLGFADIAPVVNGSQLQNVNTGEYIGLMDGRTLPIKFRIERGAFCTNQTDCGEATVGPGGGTVITNTGLAGVFIPAGALSSDVLVAIEVITARPCLPIDLLQRGGCYQFTTDPGPTQFNLLVTAGICVETAGLTATEISLLHLHQLDFVEGAPVVRPLPNTAAHFLACDMPHPPPTSLGLGRGVLGRLLAVGTQAVSTVLGLVRPAPLFASHLGVGGLTCCFSRIGWALPAQMNKQAGDGQTAVVGTAVAIPPSVMVNDSSGAPVPGETVTFSVGSGGGAITGGSASTNANGVAAVTSWTLGATPGSNTLIATSRGAVGSPLTFTATGIAATPVVHFSDVTLRGSCGSTSNPTLYIDGAPPGFGFGFVQTLGGAGECDYSPGRVDGSVINGGTLALANAYVDAWIDQGSVSRHIQSSGFLGLGNFPPGTAGFVLIVSPSNAFTLFGTGTLVPGSATLRLQVTQGATVFDVVTFPVTLANALVRIVSVNFTPAPTLTIDGPAVSFTVTVRNETNVLVPTTFVSATVFQEGHAERIGGGFYLVGCGPNPGDLLPGTCTATGTLVAQNSGFGTTFVDGSAVGWFVLEAIPCCLGVFENLYGSFVPVTLVGP